MGGEKIEDRAGAKSQMDIVGRPKVASGFIMAFARKYQEKQWMIF